MTETELTAELTRLERDDRRLKRPAALPLVLLAALRANFATRPVPDKITAHEFDVVDGSGNRHVVIDTHGGHGRVGILDSQGKARATLWVDQYGPGLGFYDAQGKVRASIDLSRGEPEIFFYDVMGKEHEAMYLTADGSTTISLTDARGFKTLLGSTDEGGTCSGVVVGQIRNSRRGQHRSAWRKNRTRCPAVALRRLRMHRRDAHGQNHPSCPNQELVLCSATDLSAANVSRESVASRRDTERYARLENPHETCINSRFGAFRIAL